MALICNRCGETFTLEEYNKMKSVAECEANLMEEFADISNAVTALCDAWFGDNLDSEREFWDAEREIEDAKYKRWLSRLEEKENKNG